MGDGARPRVRMRTRSKMLDCISFVVHAYVRAGLRLVELTAPLRTLGTRHIADHLHSIKRRRAAPDDDGLSFPASLDSGFTCDADECCSEHLLPQPARL